MTQQVTPGSKYPGRLVRPRSCHDTPIPDIVMTLDVDLVKDPLRGLQEVLLHLHGNIPGQ